MKKLIVLFVSLLPLAAPAQLVTGLEGASGSAVGPDRALYVTEGAVGRISRVNTRTGEVTTFAEGLPPSLIGIGGAIDVAFIGDTAYALVTLVGFPFDANGIDGIYRIDGPNSFTIVADLGAFSASNPPMTPFDLPNGVQYALDNYRGGFLVTDGHHNRVLRVKLDGTVTEFRGFDNIVPTGLAIAGKTVYMAQAGANPHLPEDGKIVAFGPRSPTVTEVASGAPLLVDVEFGRGRELFALSQGIWDGAGAGSPALPDTGALVEVNREGGFTTVVDGLSLPTSLEIISNTAYVVTLDGKVWKFDNISDRGSHHDSHHGSHHDDRD
jgi:hypothetical protein